MELGFSGIPDSFSCIRDFKAKEFGFQNQNFSAFWILDSGFHKNNFAGFRNPNSLRDLSEISRGRVGGGGGGGNRGRVTTFLDSEKGGVIKNGLLKGGGSCKYMPVIM